jgi:hypothetical protein
VLPLAQVMALGARAVASLAHSRELPMQQRTYFGAKCDERLSIADFFH